MNSARPPTWFVIVVGGAMLWALVIVVLLGVLDIIDLPAIDSSDEARPDRFDPPSGGG